MMGVTADTELVEIRLTFTRVETPSVKDVARALMERLSRLDRVADPVVSGDPARGEISVSFELCDATGDALADVGEALRIVAGAQERDPDALTRPHRVEYLKAG
jgi:hypothetical protein